MEPPSCRSDFFEFSIRMVNNVHWARGARQHMNSASATKMESGDRTAACDRFSFSIKPLDLRERKRFLFFFCSSCPCSRKSLNRRAAKIGLPHSDTNFKNRED
ncbi:hypothetical protein VNO77_10170 [Canavalia gladiata]|uniref:Uncharacterized protein n=1 Tax=Canavalia gladiata TaxID=3824 RepID=A0AAN9QUL2_CANGL